MIPEQTINRIKDRANDEIVDIVGRYVDLKRAGNSWKGLCPYHEENTASFSVSEAKGVFKCFGCGAGGDAVQFVMDHEGLEFIPAIRWLADRLYITIQEEQGNTYRQRHPEQPPLTGAGLQGMKPRIRKHAYVVLFLDEESKRLFQDKESEPWLLAKRPLNDKDVVSLSKYCPTIFIQSSVGYKNETVFTLLGLLLKHDFNVYILSGNTAPGLKRTYRGGLVEMVEDQQDWLTYLLNHYGPDDFLKSGIQKAIACIDEKFSREFWTREFINRWNNKIQRIST